MSKIHFTIPIPTFIESIFVYFLLRYRKKKYGLPFRKIKLTKDKFAKVDSEDYQKLTQYAWQLFESRSKNFYAIRYEGRKIVCMHRVIMNAPKGSIVDHKNRDSLDNTKQNLRFATRSQNSCNSQRKKSSSKYRDVHQYKKRNKWTAQLNYNSKKLFLGYFDNEEDAARAYDEAAKIYHGEFAVLNFPPPTAGVGANRNDAINSLAKGAV